MASRAGGVPPPPYRAGRVRVPPPLIRVRMPSGRGATEQPNATGDGDAALTPVFWLMVALTGAAAGLAWSLAWPGSPPGAYAVVGAAAMLGAAMQAPLAGLALMLELTGGGFAIVIPMVAATVTATAVARYVDGYSIYTARLRAR
jgi:chloride channel protein, CIC family